MISKVGELNFERPNKLHQWSDQENFPGLRLFFGILLPCNGPGYTESQFEVDSSSVCILCFFSCFHLTSGAIVYVQTVPILGYLHVHFPFVTRPWLRSDPKPVKLTFLSLMLSTTLHGFAFVLLCLYCGCCCFVFLVCVCVCFFFFFFGGGGGGVSWVVVSTPCQDQLNVSCICTN